MLVLRSQSSLALKAHCAFDFEHARHSKVLSRALQELEINGIASSQISRYEAVRNNRSSRSYSV
ncbi:hypothetical protein CJ215_01475 [Gardnerella swidsinskii]|nr:hypothetical protein CJ215_01475 [Gardnerella vaginalis]